jgi:hypothetical protein
MPRCGSALSLSLLLSSAPLAASAQPPAPPPLPPVSEVQVTIGPRLEAEAHDYGQSDLDMLAHELKKDVEDQLRRKGRLQPGGVRLMLTITDATPNHPTAAQLGNDPQLDPMRSVGRGSATIDGVEIRPDGARRPVHFDYRQTFLPEAGAQSTWGDAETTFEWFAREYAQGRRGG